ncbi:MAG: hypothetical protein OXU74_09455 [Gemmatimonadota bacterium]|nr:hypothetical protein [Gemmatimonadota bacterium]
MPWSVGGVCTWTALHTEVERGIDRRRAIFDPSITVSSRRWVATEPLCRQTGRPEPSEETLHNF